MIMGQPSCGEERYRGIRETRGGESDVEGVEGWFLKKEVIFGDCW